MVQEEYKDEDKGLRFEEEDSCVHAAKPDSDAVAPVEFDNASEEDPEAASLAGSVRPSRSDQLSLGSILVFNVAEGEARRSQTVRVRRL